ncbi:Type II secretory pathway, component PulJ [Gallibacterium trehalosifermentans]|uniref:Type II secretory pathway, component PulJ n=1 Tax=Gallibacterium trehalosifermentans TaxID=516935 RepID=A0ABV6H2I3_9PAST
MMCHRSPRFFIGATLPELLMAIALTSLLVLILSNWLLSLYHYQSQRQQQLQLQQDVHQALQMIRKDLRRSGYHYPNKNNNLALFRYQNKSINLVLPKQDYYQCVLFFYDLNKDGCIGNKQGSESCMLGTRNNTTEIQKELFGYRLAAGNLEVLFMFDKTIDHACSAVSCQQHLNNPTCQSKGWSKYFDSRYRVESLAFRWLPENRGMSVDLTVVLRNQENYRYQATVLIPLLNEVQE